VISRHISWIRGMIYLQWYSSRAPRLSSSQEGYHHRTTAISRIKWCDLWHRPIQTISFDLRLPSCTIHIIISGYWLTKAQNSSNHRWQRTETPFRSSRLSPQTKALLQLASTLKNFAFVMTSSRNWKLIVKSRSKPSWCSKMKLPV